MRLPVSPPGRITGVVTAVRQKRPGWSVLPEYNPFKYNSFPVNAARQSWLLTQALQKQLNNDEKWKAGDTCAGSGFPVRYGFNRQYPRRSGPLFTLLPANGSALVLFDINQAATLRPLFRPGAYVAAESLLLPAPRCFTTTVVTNASAQSLAIVARTTRG